MEATFSVLGKCEHAIACCSIIFTSPKQVLGRWKSLIGHLRQIFLLCFYCMSACCHLENIFLWCYVYGRET